MSQDEPPDAFQIGAEIRRLCRAKNLTLGQLAYHAGLTPHFIGSIELGQRDPSISTLEAIAGALDVTVSVFLGEAPPISKKAVEMGKLFDDAPELLQKGILKLLRAAFRPRRR